MQKTEPTNSSEPVEVIETNMYDKVEYHFNAAVQILTNSVTGETSVGWTTDPDLIEYWREQDDAQ